MRRRVFVGSERARAWEGSAFSCFVSEPPEQPRCGSGCLQHHAERGAIRGDTGGEAAPCGLHEGRVMGHVGQTRGDRATGRNTASVWRAHPRVPGASWARDGGFDAAVPSDRRGTDEGLDEVTHRMRDMPMAATPAAPRRRLRDARRLAMRGDWSVDPWSGDTSGATTTSMGRSGESTLLACDAGDLARGGGRPPHQPDSGEDRGPGSGCASTWIRVRGRPSELRAIEARTLHGVGLLADRASTWCGGDTGPWGSSMRIIPDASRSCHATAAIDAAVKAGPVDRPPTFGEGGGATEASSGASARRDRATLDPPCTGSTPSFTRDESRALSSASPRSPRWRW